VSLRPSARLLDGGKAQRVMLQEILCSTLRRSPLQPLLEDQQDPTSVTRQLRCYVTNVRSLGDKLAGLHHFLSNRFQYVKVDKCYSSIFPFISGVPQGSVLGPLLFILYVNDICTLSPAGVTIKLFADDTKLYTVFSDIISARCLQNCLTAIFDWSEYWQLKLSPSKCSVMRITPVAQHPTNNEIEYYIGQTKLPVVDHITDLGVAYNNRLKFSPHVDNIVSKASLRAKLILRCFQPRDCVTHQGILCFCPTSP